MIKPDSDQSESNDAYERLNRVSRSERTRQEYGNEDGNRKYANRLCGWTIQLRFVNDWFVEIGIRWRIRVHFFDVISRFSPVRPARLPGGEVISPIGGIANVWILTGCSAVVK